MILMISTDAFQLLDDLILLSPYHVEEYLCSAASGHITSCPFSYPLPPRYFTLQYFLGNGMGTNGQPQQVTAQLYRRETSGDLGGPYDQSVFETFLCWAHAHPTYTACARDTTTSPKGCPSFPCFVCGYLAYAKTSAHFKMENNLLGLLAA